MTEIVDSIINDASSLLKSYPRSIGNNEYDCCDDRWVLFDPKFVMGLLSYIDFFCSRDIMNSDKRIIELAIRYYISNYMATSRVKTNMFQSFNRIKEILPGFKLPGNTILLE